MFKLVSDIQASGPAGVKDGLDKRGQHMGLGLGPLPM